MIILQNSLTKKIIEFFILFKKIIYKINVLFLISLLVENVQSMSWAGEPLSSCNRNFGNRTLCIFVCISIEGVGIRFFGLHLGS
jgi:hypothetical protein